MAKRKTDGKIRRKPSKGALIKGVSQPLPRELLFEATFREELRGLMRGYSGLYVLYRRKRLYYIGLAGQMMAAPIAVTGLRGRYNERGDFLITTTPPMNEATATAGDLLFPHIVAGSGYNTQIIIYGQPGSGGLYLVGQDGASK